MTTNPFIAKSIGKDEPKSRTKANTAMARTEDGQKMVDSEAWPRGVQGTPMMKVVMTASELIPTGQYANISVGPCQITAFIDADRILDPDESYFTGGQREVLARALNELADIVEADVVAVQRNLVMESMQQQIGDK